MCCENTPPQNKPPQNKPPQNKPPQNKPPQNKPLVLFQPDYRHCATINPLMMTKDMQRVFIDAYVENYLENYLRHVNEYKDAYKKEYDRLESVAKAKDYDVHL
jgi:hypothetical protein